jgi:DsbC/DsbD-like thiol-disulfide interchange protein
MAAVAPSLVVACSALVVSAAAVTVTRPASVQDAPAPPAPLAPALAAPAAKPAKQEGIASSSIHWMRTVEGQWVLSVTIEPAPGWHAYWENPGDSGSSPEIALTLPLGWTAGPVVYPRPDVAHGDDGAFYGYGSRVHYLVPVRRAGAAGDPVAAGEPVRPEPWSAKASVMVCKERCLMASFEASGADATAGGDALPLGLTGGTVGGRSLPDRPESLGIMASIAAGRVQIHGPARSFQSVRFIPAAVPGLQVTLPEGAAAVEGTVVNGRFRIDVPFETLGSDPAGPAFAGLVLLGNQPADPCVRLSLPHPAGGAASGAPVTSNPPGSGPGPGR